PLVSRGTSHMCNLRNSHKNKLYVHDNRKDSIVVNVYGKCSPFNASLVFKNTKFHAGEVITIKWGDGKDSTLVLTADQVIDSFTHLYDLTGLDYMVLATVTNPAKCMSQASYYIHFGKIVKILLSNAPCAKTEVCFAPNILDTKTNITWTEQNKMGQLTWWSSFNSKKDAGFTHCETFPKGGYYEVTLQVNDSNGCNEIYTEKIFIKEIKAGIKKHLHDVYCTELTQYFDSSTLVGDVGDNIVSYLWDFGTKQFSVYDKDPSKAFDLPGDSLRITHVVVSNDGCTDTATSAIKFIGAYTYFRIKDTIACGTLAGVFYNLSNNCSQYIWEYGNDSNSTFNTDTKETAYKTYRKVGKYKVRLRGIQSVFNPFTNNIYYCSSVFPDAEYSKDSSRTVWVMPDYKSAILSRDTICEHDTVHFASAVDTIYKMNKWVINDSSFIISKSPYQFSHQFNKEGVYRIKLKPEVPFNNPLLSCLDSAEKKIVVVRVRAGFTIDDNLVPNIQFINTSTPKYATYQWSFGDQSSGSNSSTDENPTHNYIDLTKQYQICLVATIKYGCADTICKPLGPYSSYCSVYNVFTPGNNDGLNDLYDVVIEGESSYNLTIYDRWGVVVYKATKDNDDLDNNNWNGRVHNTGEECSAGTYYYIFNYAMETKPSEKKTVEGVITLIR
ncbi:MAG: gliding motility-associated C-terminal domain-containing protein, partial [bacterium]|nr:gliding motility-associated C-terminal domain-containing protein [bacterium]